MRLGLRVVFYIHLHLDDLKTYSKRGVSAPLFLNKIVLILLGAIVADFSKLYYLCR